jgi:two-component system, chemotaxis family, sensor histidine kinase and response regulator PixL
MAVDKEQEVRLHFLGEAQEYLSTIESGLIGVGTHGVDRSQMDAVLRAAHSIKGGAAMMGFNNLSQIAHRLEDFFKILKVGRVEIDGDIERYLLWSVDRLRQIVTLNREGSDVDQDWLDENAAPIIDYLHDRLGDPTQEDAAMLLSEEAGEDMAVLLFETEVEGCLQRLEAVLENPDKPCLVEEFTITAQELGGLGEMLELTAFSSLCQSIVEQLEANPDNSEAIARFALQEWRRSQAMVFIGQASAIPAQLRPIGLDSSPTPQEAIPTPVEENEIETFPEFAEFEELEAFEEIALEPEALEALDAIEEIEEIEELEAIEFLSTQDFSQDAQDFLESLDSISASNPTEVKSQFKVESTDEVGSKTSPVSSEGRSPTPSSKTPASEKVEENTIRVAVRQLDQLSNQFGELTIERNGLDLQLKRMRDLLWTLSNRVKNLEQANFRLRGAYDKVATNQGTNAPLVPQLNILNIGAITPDEQEFDTLEMDRYSELHLVSQEIMETMVQIQEVTTDLQTNLEDTERSARDFNRTSKLMQSSLTQLRMRPISDLLNRFPRALREMELKYKKQVELKVRGGGTLIDRTILEALNDPLLHLFRNAFDHGIEAPAARQTAGKPEKGTIEINAAYRGNQTVITIRDDGKGIDLDKIRAKALKMGLDESDLKNATKNDLLELIFMPGFSTAEHITDLSGRGVGMDVVRTNLQQIRGEIQVDTQLEVGTTFTITVPFTLSVVRVLLVESGEMLLAFPTSAVEEMLRLKNEDILQTIGKEVLNWEGSMVPLIRLSQWFQFARSHRLADTESVPLIDDQSVLLIAQGDDLVGILVDRYWGEQEVTIRQVEGTLAMSPGFSGCTILGDGRVVPLVDAIALLRWIDNNEDAGSSHNLSHSLNTLKSDSPDAIISTKKDFVDKTAVLVVDDSINVRRFVAMTLEKAGYRVEQAKDGQDALDKLKGGLVVQAVVSDIEMPRLDGYGFLAHVKSDPNCQHLPIIMLTSRSGEKHRQIAMNLGASAYFSKPFREPELLKTIQQLTQKQLSLK